MMQTLPRSIGCYKRIRKISLLSFILNIYYPYFGFCKAKENSQAGGVYAQANLWKEPY
jgi:hypothetical protein